MFDDVFTNHSLDLASIADLEIDQRLARALRAPLRATPCDFGLDRLWVALEVERLDVRDRCRRRRLLRLTALLRRWMPRWPRLATASTTGRDPARSAALELELEDPVAQ